LEDIRHFKSQTRTVAICLGGVLSAVTATNEAEALLYLGASATPCKTASQIIEDL